MHVQIRRRETRRQQRIHQLRQAAVPVSYTHLVGRNANLLIGCVPDTKGLISQDQVDSFVGLGHLINTRLTVHAGMSDKMIGKDRMDCLLYTSVLGGIYLFPRAFTCENYKEFFTNSSWLKALWITFFRTLTEMCIRDRCKNISECGSEHAGYQS